MFGQSSKWLKWTILLGQCLMLICKISVSGEKKKVLGKIKAYKKFKKSKVLFKCLETLKISKMYSRLTLVVVIWEGSHIFLNDKFS